MGKKDKERDVHEQVRFQVDDFMKNYMGETKDSLQKNENNFGAMSLVDSWFNPEPQLIKHLIIIQMIAAMIVTALMIIVEAVLTGDNYVQTNYCCNRIWKNKSWFYTSGTC
jgi:hypothetical protein